MKSINGSFKAGDILLYKTTIPSFSWGNGLKIIVNINAETDIIHICDFDNEGNPSKYDDGRYMCSVTTFRTNGNLYPTKLKFKLEKNVTFL